MGWRDWFGLARAAAPRAPGGFRVAMPTSYVRSFLAASNDRLASDMVPFSAPRNINAELRASLATMRARARHLAKNNDHAKAFLRLVRRNIVGPGGLTLQMQVYSRDGAVLDKDANARIEESFDGWSRFGKCTVDAGLGRASLERMLVSTVATDGEVLLRKVRGWKGNKWRFALQLIDADQLPENLNVAAISGGAVGGVRIAEGHDVVMGVERDAWKRPVAYWLRQRNGLEVSPAVSMDYQRVPAEDVLHIFVPEFIGQVRGAPWFFTGMRRLAMLAGYEEAELVAARVASSKMGFFTSEGDDAPAPADGVDASGARFTEAQPGAFDQLPPGVDFKQWDPQHPTEAYSAFTKSLLRAFASGSGVAYSSLTGDLEGANYSSLRQGALEEREEWRVMQAWLVEQYAERVFEAWLDETLAWGALPTLDPTQFDRWHKPKFVARGWQWVDPAKEIAADEGAVKLGVKTRRQICAERGLDFAEVLEQLALERAEAERLGVDISGSSSAPAPAPAADPSPSDPPSDEEENENADDKARQAAARGKLRSRRR